MLGDFINVQIAEVYFGEKNRYVFRGIVKGLEIYGFAETAEEALNKYLKLADDLPEGRSFVETLTAALTGS